MRVTDPVCKMELAPNEIVGQSEYQGKTYSFCSASCKLLFDKDPDKYVKTTSAPDQKPSDH